MKASVNTLVVGHPRSGTTWVSEVLGAGRSVISEPDNEVAHPLGLGFKRSHRFTGPEEFASSGLRELFERAAFGDPEDIWRRALQRAVLSMRWRLEPWVAAQCGHPAESQQTRSLDPDRFPGRALAIACRQSMRRSIERPDGRIIKSVHGIRCVSNIADACQAQTLVVIRNPFAVAASLRRPMLMAGRPDPVENPDRWRRLPGLPEGPNRDLHQIAWLLAELLRQSAGRSDWLVVSHDELCRNPQHEFERIADRLGLPAAPIMDSLATTVGDGSGLSVQRTSTIEQIDSWKTTLDDASVVALRELVDEHGIAEPLARLGATGDR